MIIRCNGTCSPRAEFQTANVMAGHTRAWLKSNQGWGRGLRKGHKCKDLCASCMPAEVEAFKKQKADWEAEKKRRDEIKKAKLLPKPPRSKRSASPSPSADSAPAPATT